MIVSDDSGGAIITWYDLRNGTDNDIYAQRVRSDSTKLWTTNGIAICTSSGDQLHPTIVNDVARGAIITWYDHRSGTNNDIYAQRINTSGSAQWTANGLAICTASGDQYYPTIARDGTGGAMITWYDGRSGIANSDIYAQRIDKLGNLYPAPWIDNVGDIANDQGGKLDVLWKPSSLDTWGNTSVRSYTVKIGVRTTGLLGKTDQTSSDGIYWRTAGSVTADWSDGYSMVISTNADSGLQGVPYYYLQVIAKNADSTVFWTSNVDSGFSIDNIPPVGISGSVLGTSGNGTISLQWNKDRVDPDLMGYEVYRSTTSGFAVDKANQLALSFDTTFTDTSVSFGQTYYYRVATMDVHGNTGTPSSEMNQVALAVTLTSFTASSSHLSADLRWSTAAGAIDYNFEIDRTTVGRIQSWQKVGFVAGSSINSSSQQYEYIDRDVSAGTYDYRIKLIASNGGYAYTSTVEVQVGVAPKEFTLSQNYPNPFNPTTNIEFTVPQDGRVQLKVYNTLGEEVATLLDGAMTAGEYHRVSFDASHLGSGVYFARIQFANRQLVKKMLLMK
jgi:hypothetical protein